MEKDTSKKDRQKADVKKQNQDLANIPAASEKIKPGEKAQKAKKEIRKTSGLHPDGKTDNTEHNRD